MKTRGLWSVEKRLGKVIKIIKEKSSGRKDFFILEIGCGYGMAMKQLQEIFPHVKIIGMNVKQYKEQIAGQNYVYGNAGNCIPLQSNHVDFIYSIATWPFIINRARLFEEAYRVLKPGGQFRIGLIKSFEQFDKEHKYPDIIDLGNNQKTNLRDYLLKLNQLDIKLEKCLIINKHKRDETLNLNLQLVPEKCMDYGPIYGRKYERFMLSCYKLVK